jgi:hypothetical protein
MRERRRLFLRPGMRAVAELTDEQRAGIAREVKGVEVAVTVEDPSPRWVLSRNGRCAMSIPPSLLRRAIEPARRARNGEKGTGQMKVMVIVKATRESENEIGPGDEELLREMNAYNEQLVKAGIMLAGEGLRPSKHGKRVRFSGAQRKVIDGPFSETKELVAGFWLWQVKSTEEAVEWVRRCPNPMPGSEAEIEIRPLYEENDFAAADPTGELRKKERELREELEARPG